MKKITSILIALIFIVYLGGIQVIYWLKMSTHKQETKTAIECREVPKDNTIKFSFTSAEYSSLVWLERNKEFTYQGQRYDIIGMHYCSDEIIVTCYSDREETDLVNAFSGFIKKMFASPQPNTDNTNDISSKLCKEYLPSEFFSPPLFSNVVISIKAGCVLVDVSAKIDDIWHPPIVA